MHHSKTNNFMQVFIHCSLVIFLVFLSFILPPQQPSWNSRGWRHQFWCPLVAIRHVDIASSSLVFPVNKHGQFISLAVLQINWFSSAGAELMEKLQIVHEQQTTQASQTTKCSMYSYLFSCMLHTCLARTEVGPSLCRLYPDVCFFSWKLC